MIEFLQKIFIGHAHRWETLKEVRLETRDDFFGGTPSVQSRFYCRCTICGKHKKFD